MQENKSECLFSEHSVFWSKVKVKVKEAKLPRSFQVKLTLKLFCEVRVADVERRLVVTRHVIWRLINCRIIIV